MIRDRKRGDQERFARLVQGAAFFDGAIDEVFVADSPDGGEGRLGKMLLLNEPVVAVAHGIGAHAVE